MSCSQTEPSPASLVPQALAGCSADRPTPRGPSPGLCGQDPHAPAAEAPGHGQARREAGKAPGSALWPVSSGCPSPSPGEMMDVRLQGCGGTPGLVTGREGGWCPEVCSDFWEAAELRRVPGPAPRSQVRPRAAPAVGVRGGPGGVLAALPAPSGPRPCPESGLPSQVTLRRGEGWAAAPCLLLGLGADLLAWGLPQNGMGGCHLHPFVVTVRLCPSGRAGVPTRCLSLTWRFRCSEGGKSSFVTTLCRATEQGPTSKTLT